MIKKQWCRALPLLLLLPLLPACKGNDSQQTQSADTATTKPATTAYVPQFNADSAYSEVKAQVAFGPRIPGSPAQKQCADWMQAKLHDVCDTVYRQTTTLTGGDKKPLPCINIIGVIHPAATHRILLLAHWDSRPWADQDIKDQDKPILAADDGGSGVAVLIEVARALKAHPLPANTGIDILLTDVEDYGKTQWGDASYALGTQYWAAHPHIPGYKADYGILLDMVGARDAVFPLEQTSTGYAPDVQQRIWKAATDAGYSSFFPMQAGGGITDDHTFVNSIAHIPTIDIINLANNGNFASHWHTHNDDMNIIDPKTMKAVGQTLLQALFTE